MNRLPKSIAVGLFSLAALSFAASPVVAQTMANAADSAFLMKASQANMAEVAAGKMAQQMGASMDVRSLGAKLASDHSANEQKLMALAKTLHVTLPMKPAPADEAMAMKLKEMSGASFDGAYLKMEDMGHQKNIAAFKSEAGMTKNPMVMKYANATLPALQMHLTMVETDMSKMRTSNMNSGGSMGSGMSGGSMGSGAAGSQNSGKSSSSGGQDGTPASNGAGGTGSRSMSSPMPMGTGNMNPTSGGKIGTPASSGAGGTGNSNTGPNTSGGGSGSSSGTSTGGNPAPNNGTGGAPNPTASPNVPPGQKTN